MAGPAGAARAERFITVFFRSARHPNFSRAARLFVRQARPPPEYLSLTRIYKEFIHADVRRLR